MTRNRSIHWLVLTLLFASVAAHAEPSRAYLKCQEKLEKSASVHLERSNRIRDKHERRIAELLEQASSRTDPEGADILRAAVERIRQWRDVEQARSTYVETIVKEVAELVSPDGPGFKCLDHGRVLKVYMGNQQAYEKVLEHVEMDVVDRIDLENLAPDEGLVIVSYNADVPLYYVRVDRRDTVGGNIEFRPLRAGQYYRLVKAKAGSYVWDSASEDLGDAWREYGLRKFDLGFSVKAGTINYMGTLLIESRRSGYFSVAQNDRLVIALHMLEDRYPELIGRYEITNGLFPDDRFTEFYLREKASYREGGSDAAE